MGRRIIVVAALVYGAGCGSTPQPTEVRRSHGPSHLAGQNTSPPAATGRPLAQRVTEQTISVAPSKVHIDGYLASYALLAQAPDQNMRLAWNDSNTLHVTPLNAAFQRVGKDWTLPGYVVASVLALPDNSYLLAVVKTIPGKSLFNSFHSALALEVLRLTPNNRVSFRTRITGGQGDGAGNVWLSYSAGHSVRLGFNGREYGVFTKVSKNFGKPGAPDTHQGDLFVVLDRKGRIQPKRTQLWSASHSNMLKMVVDGNGRFLTGTVGDAYPFGILVIDRSTKKRAIVWPDADQRTPAIVKKVRSVADAGSLCGMTRVGDRFFATVGTTRRLQIGKYDGPSDVLLLGFAEDGTQLTRHWLVETPNKKERCPRVAAYGKDLLVGWNLPNKKRYQFSSPGHLMVVGTDGRIKAGPVVTHAKMPTGSSGEFFSFANGDVGWVQVGYKSSEIKVYRVAQR